IVGRAVVAPSNGAGQNVLWPHVPLETDERRGAEVRLAHLLQRMGECIGLVPGGGGLCLLLPFDPLHSGPRVAGRYDHRMLALDDVPSAACNVDAVTCNSGALRLSWPLK